MVRGLRGVATTKDCMEGGNIYAGGTVTLRTIPSSLLWFSLLLLATAVAVAVAASPPSPAFASSSIRRESDPFIPRDQPQQYVHPRVQSTTSTTPSIPSYSLLILSLFNFAGVATATVLLLLLFCYRCCYHYHNQAIFRIRVILQWKIYTTLRCVVYTLADALLYIQQWLASFIFILVFMFSVNL